MLLGLKVVVQLKIYLFTSFESMGALQAKIPTEVLVTDRKEFELAEEGFISLTIEKR